MKHHMLAASLSVMMTGAALAVDPITISLVNPEDIAVVPGTDVVVASSMTGAGIKGGNVSAVHVPTRAVTQLFPAKDAIKSPPADSTCPGPITADVFAPHGIAVTHTKDRARLYVVNHGGREAIEIFDLKVKGDKAAATWIDCIPMPPDAPANGVALAGDAVFATNNGRALGAAKADPMNTDVLVWRAGAGWKQVAPAYFGAPNGIEVSPTGDRVYAALWYSKEVVEITPGTDGTKVRRLAVPFLPDNLRWDKDGALLVAGQDTTPEVVTQCHYGTRKDCFAPSGYVRIDVKTMKVLCHRAVPPAESFGSATVATPVGDDLWLGQARGNTIMVVPRKEKGGC